MTTRSSVFEDEGRVPLAVLCYLRAIHVDPKPAETYTDLVRVLPLLACSSKTEPPVTYFRALEEWKCVLEAETLIRSRLGWSDIKPPDVASVDPADEAAWRQAATSLYRAYAELLCLMREWDKARKYYKMALACDPEDATLHGRLAYTLTMLGQREAAIRCLKKALYLNPRAYALQTA